MKNVINKAATYSKKLGSHISTFGGGLKLKASATRIVLTDPREQANWVSAVVLDAMVGFATAVIASFLLTGLLGYAYATVSAILAILWWLLLGLDAYARVTARATKLVNLANDLETLRKAKGN